VNDAETVLHEQRLDAIEKAAGQTPVWRRKENPELVEES
jgi:hypothetical protein